MLDPMTLEFLQSVGIDPATVEVVNVILDPEDPQQRIQMEAFASMYPLVISTERTGGKCEDPMCECGGKGDAVQIRAMSSLVN